MKTPKPIPYRDVICTACGQWQQWNHRPRRRRPGVEASADRAAWETRCVDETCDGRGYTEITDHETDTDTDNVVVLQP